jgi:hypothetical protein
MPAAHSPQETAPAFMNCHGSADDFVGCGSSSSARMIVDQVYGDPARIASLGGGQAEIDGETAGRRCHGEKLLVFT